MTLSLYTLPTSSHLNSSILIISSMNLTIFRRLLHHFHRRHRRHHPLCLFQYLASISLLRFKDPTVSEHLLLHHLNHCPYVLYVFHNSSSHLSSMDPISRNSPNSRCHDNNQIFVFVVFVVESYTDLSWIQPLQSNFANNTTRCSISVHFTLLVGTACFNVQQVLHLTSFISFLSGEPLSPHF